MAINTEDLANAYQIVARVNHYLIGIVSEQPRTWEELATAKQILIDRQNRLEQDSPEWRTLARALDLIGTDINYFL